MSELLTAIASIQVPWMLAGSVGAMSYCEPRATLDVDCILALRPGHERRVIQAFPEVDFYCPPHEVIAHEIRRGARGCFNVIHHQTGFKADLYPSGDDDLMHWGLSQCRQFPVAGVQVPVAPPEYIVAMKLRYFALSGQDKHLRDIRSMLRLMPDLDRVLVEQWAARYGVGEAWRLVRA